MRPRLPSAAMLALLLPIAARAAVPPSQASYAVNLGMPPATPTVIVGHMPFWIDTTDSSVNPFGLPRPVSDQSRFPVSTVPATGSPGSGAATPTYVLDANSAAFQGVVAITPGVATPPQRSIGFICTASGAITLTLADTSTVTIGLVASPAFQSLPFRREQRRPRLGHGGNILGIEMTHRILASMVATLALSGSANALPPTASPPAVIADALGRTPTAKTYPQGGQLKGICKSWAFSLASNVSSTYSGESERLPCTTLGPVSRIALAYSGLRINSGTEIAGFNPVFFQAVLEYPAGIATQHGVSYSAPQFGLDGSSTVEVQPTIGLALTDPLHVNIPAASTFYIRTAAGVASPPTAGAASASAGGGLAASTPYYYELSCKKADAESGPGVEFSATTGSTTLSMTLSWTASTAWVGCDAVKIYRSATSGAETYLATVAAPALSFVDTGFATVAGQTPAAAQRYPYLSYVPSGGLATGATGANLVQSVTTGGFSQVGPYPALISGPDLILGDDVANPTLCNLSDSVGYGAGIQAAGTYNNQGPFQANWFDLATPPGSYNTINMSVSGTHGASMANASGYYGGAGRMRTLDYCDAIVSDLSVNDIDAGEGWQQIAANQLQIARTRKLRGNKYFVTTLPPHGVSSDNMLTLAGQTINAGSEATRLNYNAWVRGGLLVDGTGAALLTGGTKTPWIDGYWDLAAAIGEVNASGVPTLNGGYWPVYPNALATGTLAGTPTATSLPFASVTGLSGAAHALVGYVLKMTSGSVSGSCVIADNTTTTITCNGGTVNLAAPPAAGSSFAIFQTASLEQIHPSYLMNVQMSASFQAWMASSGFSSF